MCFFIWMHKLSRGQQGGKWETCNQKKTVWYILTIQEEPPEKAARFHLDLTVPKSDPPPPTRGQIHPKA